MNRKLLALSVAAALTAPGAASALDYDIYGRLHLSLTQMDNDDSDSLNLTSNSSRLGIKGSHELTDGLTGIFQIESGLSADNGGGELATRNTFAGLRGNFGTVRAGQFDTAVKKINGAVDFFSDQVGDNQSLPAIKKFDLRAKNIVGYTSPNFGGFQVDLEYSTNLASGVAKGSDGRGDKTSSWIAAASYRVDNLYVALGYQQLNEGTDANEPSVIKLGAYYDFGPLRISGLAQQIDSDDSAEESTVYGVGARYRFGDFAVKAQYYLQDADAAESDASLIAVGGEYRMAKNLTWYLDYAMMKNDDNVAYHPWDAVGDKLDGPVAGGDDAHAVSLGMIYNF